MILNNSVYHRRQVAGRGGAAAPLARGRRGGDGPRRQARPPALARVRRQVIIDIVIVILQ